MVGEKDGKGDDVFSSFGTLLNARILSGGAAASLYFFLVIPFSLQREVG